MVDRNHRQWQAWTRLMDAHGYECRLLAPTWDGWAWILYDGAESPATVRADTLYRPENQPARKVVKKAHATKRKAAPTDAQLDAERMVGR